MNPVSSYSEAVDADHRRRHGQYFTPPAVARFMVDWVLESGVPTLYDPACGLGAFRPDRAGIAFSASELDPLVIAHAGAHGALADTTLYHEDYLQSWGRSHANIVGNPPYLRFQLFRDREQVARLFHRHLGLRLAGHTNIASAFLLKSLHELDGSGRLAYLMPLDFLNSGYGRDVKQALIRNGRLVALIRLQCEQAVFPGVTTTVGLVLVDASQHQRSVGFYSLDDIDSLQHLAALEPVARIDTDRLDPDAKWLPYFHSQPLALDRSQLVPLEFYGHFRRGIATGANEFFALSPSQAHALGLPDDEVQPCITRSAQVRSQVFTGTGLAQLRERDATMLLLTAGTSPSAAARRYLQQGEAQGYHLRYLTRHRTPWYRTEQREPAPLWLGVFSRGGYKVILNRTEALNLTCFHGFQPNLFGRRYLDLLFLYLLSDAGHAVMTLSLRQYGDGLDKFEPNDLDAALVPSTGFFDSLDPALVASALQQVQTDATLPPALETAFASITTRSPT